LRESSSTATKIALAGVNYTMMPTAPEWQFAQGLIQQDVKESKERIPTKRRKKTGELWPVSSGVA
jgi:hypothetical protein